MIGLDTNVLARYFAQDDILQSAQATALIESLTDAEPGFQSLVTLAELVWVMQRTYKTKKSDVVRMLQQLLQAREIVIENLEAVLQALNRFSQSRAGFADCLIERCGHGAGCRDTVTFDMDAAAAAGMRLLIAHTSKLAQ